MDKEHIGELEELILLLIIMLKEEAYGFAIRKALKEQADRVVTIGAVHGTVNRLEKKGFVKSEIVRSEKTLGEFRTIVFKVVPCIIIAAALLIIFVDKAQWRAIAITTIALMFLILAVDVNSNARIEKYHEQLISIYSVSG